MNNLKFNFENEWNCIVESIWEQYVTVIHIYSNKIQTMIISKKKM